MGATGKKMQLTDNFSEHRLVACDAELSIDDLVKMPSAWSFSTAFVEHCRFSCWKMKHHVNHVSRSCEVMCVL